MLSHFGPVVTFVVLFVVVSVVASFVRMARANVALARVADAIERMQRPAFEEAPIATAPPSASIRSIDATAAARQRRKKRSQKSAARTIDSGRDLRLPQAFPARDPLSPREPLSPLPTLAARTIAPPLPPLATAPRSSAWH